MGVPGLLSFISDRKNLSTTTINLVEEARANGGIKILVDYQSFSHKFAESAGRRLQHFAYSQYICLTGLDYTYLSDFVAAFYRAFEKANIKLEFYADVARGAVDDQLFEQKCSEYIRRWECRKEQCKQLWNIANDVFPPHYPKDFSFLRAPMVDDTILNTLFNVGAKITFCCFGEADLVIAKECSLSKNVYVMSNDSDFCLIKGCRFIPLFFLERCEPYLFDMNSLLPKCPSKLLVGVVYADELHRQLGLRCRKQLIDIAITCGTDHTKSFVEGMHRKYLHCEHWFNDVLRYYMKHRCFFEGTPLFPLVMSDRNFREAVEYSRNFYEMDESMFTLPEDLSQYHRRLIHLVETGRLHSRCLAIFKKHMWEKQVYCDLTEPVYPDRFFLRINDAIAEMVLGKAVEYTVYAASRSDTHSIRSVRLSTQRGLPNIAECENLPTNERKNLLYQIFDVRIPFECNDYQNCLIFLIIKYLKVQFKSFEAKLDESELSVIALSLFPGEIPRDVIFDLFDVKPPIRCLHLRIIVELAIWYVCIFVGNPLKLSQFIGSFHSIFSPVVFSALFVYLCGPKDEALRSSKLCENLYEILMDRKAVFMSTFFADVMRQC